jgi:hypothetical protein
MPPAAHLAQGRLNARHANDQLIDPAHWRKMSARHRAGHALPCCKADTASRKLRHDEVDEVRPDAFARSGSIIGNKNSIDDGGGGVSDHL